jgi:hypothetical protein
MKKLNALQLHSLHFPVRLTYNIPSLLNGGYDFGDIKCDTKD